MKKVAFVGNSQAMLEACLAFISAKEAAEGRPEPSVNREFRFDQDIEGHVGQIVSNGKVLEQVTVQSIPECELESHLEGADWVVIEVRGRKKAMKIWSPENETRQSCPIEGLEKKNVIGVSITRDPVIAPGRVADLLTALLVAPQSCFSHTPKGTKPIQKPKPEASEAVPAGHDGISQIPAHQFDRHAGYNR